MLWPTCDCCNSKNLTAGALLASRIILLLFRAPHLDRCHFPAFDIDLRFFPPVAPESSTDCNAAPLPYPHYGNFLRGDSTLDLILKEQASKSNIGHVECPAY